jgi:hypothetical protein
MKSFTESKDEVMQQNLKTKPGELEQIYKM